MHDMGCQEPETADSLEDFSSRGRDRKWRERKMANELLAIAYADVDADKAARLRDCATMLIYRQYENGEKRLHQLNSCRVRLCPICTWRRSLRAAYTTQQIVNHLAHKGEYAYVMVTYSIRNCTTNELGANIDQLLDGVKRLMQLKEVKAACKGWYRTLEVTNNVDWESSSYDTYHPHVHMIWLVNKSYFKSRYYIPQKRFSELWRRSVRVDYDTQCDMRRVDNLPGAVAEVSKYAAKAVDYIIPDDWDLTVDAVRTLDAALANRRLVAYGGLMKEAKRELELADPDDGNLVDVGEADSEQKEYRLVSYCWYSGYRQYFRKPNGESRGSVNSA
jgi:plasmid rolling circle replication initiator protein Rep